MSGASEMAQQVKVPGTIVLLLSQHSKAHEESASRSHPGTVTVGNIEGGQGKEVVLTVTKLNAFSPSFPKGKPL